MPKALENSSLVPFKLNDKSQITHASYYLQTSLPNSAADLQVLATSDEWFDINSSKSDIKNSSYATNNDNTLFNWQFLGKGSFHIVYENINSDAPTKLVLKISLNNPFAFDDGQKLDSDKRHVRLLQKLNSKINNTIENEAMFLVNIQYLDIKLHGVISPFIKENTKILDKKGIEKLKIDKAIQLYWQEGKIIVDAMVSGNMLITEEENVAVVDTDLVLGYGSDSDEGVRRYNDLREAVIYNYPENSDIRYLNRDYYKRNWQNLRRCIQVLTIIESLPRRLSEKYRNSKYFSLMVKSMMDIAAKNENNVHGLYISQGLITYHGIVRSFDQLETIYNKFNLDANNLKSINVGVVNLEHSSSLTRDLGFVNDHLLYQLAYDSKIRQFEINDNNLILTYVSQLPISFSIVKNKHKSANITYFAHDNGTIFKKIVVENNEAGVETILKVFFGFSRMIKFYSDEFYSWSQAQLLPNTKEVDLNNYFYLFYNKDNQIICYLLMPILGINLEQYLNDVKNITIDQKLKLIELVLQELEKFQTNTQLVHGDIKLSNFVINFSIPRIFLIDWDWSSPLEIHDSPLEIHESITYLFREKSLNLPYAAPEVFRNEVCAKTDIYALTINVILDILMLGLQLQDKHHEYYYMEKYDQLCKKNIQKAEEKCKQKQSKLTQHEEWSIKNSYMHEVNYAFIILQLGLDEECSLLLTNFIQSNTNPDPEKRLSLSAAQNVIHEVKNKMRIIKQNCLYYNLPLNYKNNFSAKKRKKFGQKNCSLQVNISN